MSKKKNDQREVCTILYLDDVRTPGSMSSPVLMTEKELYEELGYRVDVVVCTNASAFATAAARASGTVVFASLDHDLGTKADGMDVLKWLLQAVDEKRVAVKPTFWIYFHTGNVVARDQMDSYYKSWMKAKEM